MKEFNIAFLGLGNVGCGAYKILKNNGSKICERENIKVNIKRILVRDLSRKRKIEVDPELLTTDINDILDDEEIDLVAEFIGGVNPAREYILRALESGKNVVTANKEVIALHWKEFEDVARRKNKGLYYEASVAGGIPVLKVLRESLQANQIKEIMGIINGTTNFILTKMDEEGKRYEESLEEAFRLGYAEADPASDVDGYDAMYKLSILSTLAFHKRVSINDIYREGISKITPEDVEFGKELGFVLKLLAISKMHEGKIEARVHPVFIPRHHPLASVKDVYNAVFIRGDAVGDLMLYGRGAGDMPTGSAVVSDIINSCLNEGRHVYTTCSNDEGIETEVDFDTNWESEFFIRMTVKDKPGVLSKIAGIFGKCDVSIGSVLQKGRNKDATPIIFVTHLSKELSVKEAIKEIIMEDCVIKVESVIRVER